MSVPNTRYIAFPIVTDSQALMQAAFTYLQTKIPGWEPSEGQLDTWMIEAFSSEAADIGTLASEVPKALFRFFGQELIGLQPVNAVASMGTATFYMTDNLGYTVPAGTQVGIRDSNNTLWAFTTTQDLVIPGASTSGTVAIVAIEPGVSSNLGTAGGPVELIDVLSYVDHVTLVAPTSGGTDAETDDEYLNRLTLELQTLAIHPILPNDFSILARNVAGVQRATTIDGYNPASGGSFGNQRMVAVAALDSNGVGVSSTIKTNIQTYLTSLREINFVVNMIDPTVSLIDVVTHVKILTGYTVSSVQSAVLQRLQNALDPRYWGIAPSDDPSDPQVWLNQTTIRWIDLVTIVRTTQGVAYVIDFTFGVHGSTIGTSDVALSGVAPIPNPGTITVVASA